MAQWLCPPLGQTLELQGKLTSDVFKSLIITVSRCDQTVDPNCMSDAAVNSLQASLGKFELDLFVVTTQINPSSVDSYKTFYIDDRSYFYFTKNFASRG
jgi:hypothetical protein